MTLEIPVLGQQPLHHFRFQRSLLLVIDSRNCLYVTHQMRNAKYGPCAWETLIHDVGENVQGKFWGSSILRLLPGRFISLEVKIHESPKAPVSCR